MITFAESIESLPLMLPGRPHSWRVVAITLMMLLGACSGESANVSSGNPDSGGGNGGGGGAGGDSTPPTVSITAPAAGNLASGSTVTVNANAADNVGVLGVRFQRNGVDISTEDTTAPYSVSWNTSGLAAGSYLLTAIARDAAGQSSTSAAVTMTITVPAPATGRADLSWTAPTANEDGSAASLSGFTIYQGTSSSNLQAITTVNSSTLSYTINNLAAGTYYFAVTAVGTNGMESTYSNVGSKNIP